MTPLQWLQGSSALPFPLSILLVSLAFLAIFLSMGTKRGRKYNLPPGPFRLPLIGNLNLLGSMPHISFRNLAAKYGPIYSLTLGRIPFVVVSSPRLAREVLRMYDLQIASRPRILAAEVLLYKCTDVGFAPYGAYWRMIRKICITELLSVRRVESYAAFRGAEIERLLDRVSSARDATVDVSQVLALYVNGVVCRSAFGSDFSDSGDYDHHDFQQLLHDFQVLMGGFLIADFYPSMEWVTKITGAHRHLWDTRRRYDAFFDQIITGHVDRRRQGKMVDRTKDLLDVLLDVQESGEEGITLTTDNVKANILMMFAAGTDTSFTAMDWAMTEMIMRPEIMKRAQEEIHNIVGKRKLVNENDIKEMKYMKAIVKETLRLHPPAPLLPREATEDFVVDGFDIPAKTRVYVNVWAIGRDPELWEDPDNFKPERFLNSDVDYKGQDFQLLPFGSGRRVCPGINFGMLTVELALAQLLHSFDWELPPGMKIHDLDLSEHFGITVQKKTHLKLVATPRNSF